MAEAGGVRIGRAHDRRAPGAKVEAAANEGGGDRVHGGQGRGQAASTADKVATDVMSDQLRPRDLCLGSVLLWSRSVGIGPELLLTRELHLGPDQLVVKTTSKAETASTADKLVGKAETTSTTDELPGQSRGHVHRQTRSWPSQAASTASECRFLKQ